MINKATLGKEVDGVIEYIYPKTSADMVEYSTNQTVAQKIQSIDTDIVSTNSRISNIVSQSGDSNTEVVDARIPYITPSDTSILDSNGACASLKDRLDSDFSSLSNEISSTVSEFHAGTYYEEIYVDGEALGTSDNESVVVKITMSDLVSPAIDTVITKLTQRILDSTKAAIRLCKEYTNKSIINAFDKYDVLELLNP
jgi:hypothetical protein